MYESGCILVLSWCSVVSSFAKFQVPKSPKILFTKLPNEMAYANSAHLDLKEQSD